MTSATMMETMAEYRIEIKSLLGDGPLAAGVAAARTGRSPRILKSRVEGWFAKRSGFVSWARELLVHNDEHSEKYLPDPDFVKLVSGAK
jgi:hypothetical protein